MNSEKMSYTSKVFEQQKPQDKAFLWEIGMLEVVSALLIAKNQPIAVDMYVVNQYNLAGCKDKLAVKVFGNEETLAVFNQLMQRAIELGYVHQSYKSEDERLAHQAAIFNLMSLENGLGVNIHPHQAKLKFPNLMVQAIGKTKEFEEINFDYRLGSFGRSRG